MERKIVQVYFNPHEAENADGVRFINYDEMLVGMRYQSLIRPDLTRLCIGMKKKEEQGERFIEVEFNDGTYSQIFNYSHIELANEQAYTRVLQNSQFGAGEEDSNVPEPGASEGSGQE